MLLLTLYYKHRQLPPVLGTDRGGRASLPSLIFTLRHTVSPRPIPHTCHVHVESEPAQHMVEENAEFHAVSAPSIVRVVHDFRI